jgi:hypothetical protein
MSNNYCFSTATMVTRTHPPCYVIRTLPVLYMPNVWRLSSENTEWRKSYLIWAVVKHWVCGECCATLRIERMKWVLRHSVCWEDDVSVAPLCLLIGWSECCATLCWEDEVSGAPLCMLRGWSEFAPLCMLRGWSEWCATLYIERMKSLPRRALRIGSYENLGH